MSLDERCTEVVLQICEDMLCPGSVSVQSRNRSDAEPRDSLVTTEHEN